MSDRFVILTAPRSGSNMLVGLLEQHPEVRCFGELMRSTPRWFPEGTRVPRPDSVLHLFRLLEDRYPSDAARFSDPGGFLEAAFATRPGGAVYGFKQHLQQQPELAARLIADRRYALILLRRENALAQYSSEKIARRTGQGSAKRGEVVVKATVAFDAGEFGRYVEQWERRWAWVLGLVEASGRSSARVSYEDLVSGDGAARVFAQLGLQKPAGLEPVTQRRNSPRIAERFDDPAAVVEAVTAMGRAGWLEELSEVS
ncbi:MAG: sulfotransferase [Planctomycetota bacterium]